MLSDTSEVVVGFSGGADSTALLHFLYYLQGLNVIKTLQRYKKYFDLGLKVENSYNKLIQNTPYQIKNKKSTPK